MMTPSVASCPRTRRRRGGATYPPGWPLSREFAAPARPAWILSLAPRPLGKKSVFSARFGGPARRGSNLVPDPGRNLSPSQKRTAPSACGLLASFLHPKPRSQIRRGADSRARDARDAMSRALLSHLLHRPPPLLAYAHSSLSRAPHSNPNRYASQR